MNPDLPSTADYFHTMIKVIEDKKPDFWRKFYPRVIDGPGWAYSPKLCAGDFALNFLSRKKGLIREDDAVAMRTYIVAMRASNAGFPTFFLTAELLRAFLLSDSPRGLPMGEFHMPFDGFSICLPRGFLKSPEDGYVTSISCAAVKAGERFTGCNSVFNNDAISQHDTFTVCAVTEDGTELGSSRNFSPNDDISTISCYIPAPGDTTLSFLPADPSDDTSSIASVPTTSSDTDFIERLLVIAIQTCLFLATRPEEVQKGILQRPGGLKKGKLRPEIWSPNVIGYRYRIPREQLKSQGEGGRSVRAHFRRGHSRLQSYGTNHALHRLIWIDPVFVGSPD